MHDHVESERQRQEYEARQTANELALEKQVNLVLEGAVRKIVDPQTKYGQIDIARTAISVVNKLRVGARGNA